MPKEEIYMINLIFDCHAANCDIVFNEEFEAIAWVGPSELPYYHLNSATIATLSARGLV